MKKTKDDPASLAKRQWPRFNPENIPTLKGITLNQGNEAHVVDISRGGALVETDVRLRPQMKIVFKVLTTQGTFRITGSVLRSSIKSLQGTPIYQSAIVFENPLTMLDDLEPMEAEVEKSSVYAEADKEIEMETEELSGAETAAETNAGASGTAVETVQVSTAAQTVFETPDIFESGVVDNPPSLNAYRPEAEDKPVISDDDGFILNVIAPGGFGVSFDSSDGLNDW